MRKRTTTIVAGVVTLGLAGSAFGAAGHHHAGRNAAAGSRLVDGKSLLPQARISERQAIGAAQSVAAGALNEVDLEHAAGRLVFNVGVGDADVKVDAANGAVVGVDRDD